MGLLAKLFGSVARAERTGIRLDRSGPFWELSGTTDFPPLLEALPALLPQGCVLYFEGGFPTGELARFLRENSVTGRAQVAYGTIWPRPSVHHVPATAGVISRLAGLMRSRASCELAVHFHVYHDQAVLLECYDAFTQPMGLAGRFPEQRVRAFTERLGVSYKRMARSGEADAGAGRPRD
jgi:hypothetical protein